MSGTVNQAFDNNQLDILENGYRTNEPASNQNATSDLESDGSWFGKRISAIDAFLSKHQRVFKIFGYVILNLLILAYIIFAGIYWRSEPSGQNCDFEWCNGYGILLILVGIVYAGLFYFLILKRFIRKYVTNRYKPPTCWERLRNTTYGRCAIKTTCYAIFVVSITIFLIFDTADSRNRLISCLGVLVIMGVGFVFSKHPEKIKWRSVFLGLALQFILGILIIRLPIGHHIFDCISSKVATFLSFAKDGAKFVFSEAIVKQGVFAFAVLPVIFFFSFIAQILSYLGVVQWITLKLGWFLQRLMDTTLCESVYAVSTPFFGMVESALLIKNYINKLTSSELHAVMCSGFSSASGAVFAAYIQFGAQPTYLITASVMSIPASLCYAKLFYPETEQSLTKLENTKLEKSSDASIMDAATNGALAALPIVLGIVANIVAFVSFVAFVNAMLSWCGGLVGYEELSLELILSKTFMPLSWVMGVPWEHCEDVATLIGLKVVVNEMVAYQRLGEFKEQGKLSDRSELIATFAICGFANPGSIGILIGGLSSLAPEKKRQIAAVAVRAFFSGTAVCLLTASIAGILVNDISVMPIRPNTTAAMTLDTLSTLS